MKNQIIVLSSLLILGGCSWVDETGSQGSTTEPSSDDSAILLTEHAAFYDRRISEKRSVQANFSLVSQGPDAASNCGDYLLPSDSAATLQDACEARLAPEECAISFSVKDSANSIYSAQIPLLRQAIALSFAVQSEDLDGNLDEDTLTLCLQAINDAPTAVDHQYQVEYGGTLETSDADFDQECAIISGSGVLKEASDDYDYASVDLNSENPCLTAIEVSPPVHARSFSLNELGGFAYTPEASLGPGAVDTFSYKVSDGDLQSETKTATITVVGENEAPEILTIDTLVVDENTSASIAVSSLARDPEGETLNVLEVSAAAHGTTTQSADGAELTYTPELDYVGTDSFNFSVQDIAGASSQGQVDILVIKANEAPSLVAPATLNYIYNNTAPETETFSVTVADRETPNSAMQLSVQSSNPAVATVRAPSAIQSNGQAILTVNPVSNGSTTLTLTVTDDGLSNPVQRPAKSASATVLVQVRGINTNRPPIANNGSRDVQQGETLALDLRDFSSDPDGDTLSFSLINPPTGTSIAGTYLRISAAATQSVRRFSVNYRASDGDQQDTGRITINVTEEPNNAPVISNASARVQAGQTATVDLATLASDADGDTLSFNLVNPPSGATLVGTRLNVTTSANVGDSVIRVSYRVSDGEDSDTGVFTVTVTEIPNNAPVANNASSTIQAGNTASIDLRTISSDADGDSLSYSLVNAPSGASLVGGNTLRVTTATSAASQTIRVTYRASDGEDSDTGVFTVTVTEIPNNAPVANNASSTIQAGNTASIDLRTISSDADGDSLSYSLVNAPSGASLVGGNTLRVTTAT
ncbi:MAG: Ig-like domain-containing protein, partial [Granulosicoccaceae bacterium]